MSKKLDKVILKLAGIEKSIKALLSRGQGSRAGGSQEVQPPAVAPGKDRHRSHKKPVAGKSKRKTSPAKKATKAANVSSDVTRRVKSDAKSSKKARSAIRKVPLEIVQEGFDGAPDKVISLDQLAD